LGILRPQEQIEMEFCSRFFISTLKVEQKQIYGADKQAIALSPTGTTLSCGVED